MAAQPRVLLTVTQAARALSIGRTTLYTLISTGELASIKIGAARRVPLTALHDYTNRNTTRADAA